MRFDSFTAFFAVSNAILGVAAGPLAAKRQDATTTSSADATSSSGVTSVSTSTRSVASIGLIETVIDGVTTTIEAFAPGATDASATATDTASKTTATDTFSKTGGSAPIATAKACSIDSSNKNPFCQPSNSSTLYYGKPYLTTWDPSYFPDNSTNIVQIRFANDSTQEVWSSGQTENSWGIVAVKMKKEWMQGYSMYNLTFHMLNYEASAPSRAASTYDGPEIVLTNEPPNHYKAPAFTKVPDKAGLLIGLPVTLGALVIIIIGLYFGMKKHRTIGLGNIMGRRKGYGVGKSSRQRMGLGKKKGGAIRLEERDDYSRSQYQPANGHSRGDSLGSLVSDDGIRPAPGTNHFRSEMDRQKTGR